MFLIAYEVIMTSYRITVLEIRTSKIVIIRLQWILECVVISVAFDVI